MKSGVDVHSDGGVRRRRAFREKRTTLRLGRCIRLSTCLAISLWARLRSMRRRQGLPQGGL